MTSSRFLKLICLPPLLASCTVGPDYQRPTEAMPATWANTSDNSTTSVDHTWWHCFSDPVLTQLVDMTYKQNHDIKIAIERLHQSRANVDSKFADLLPQLSLSGQIERERNTVTAFPVVTPFAASQTHFDASWEIDLFGKNRRRLEAEEALSDATLVNLNAIQVSVIAEVVRNYIDYRLNEELLKITEENLDTQKQTVNLTKKQFSAGQAARFDFLRADTQFKTTQSQQPKYAAAMTAAQYRLEVLLGLHPQALTPILRTGKGVPITPSEFKLQSPVNVIRQRPDVSAAERQLAAATAMEGVAIAQMYPQLSLSGFFGALSAGSLGLGSNSPEKSHLFSSTNRSWYEAAAISVPIFNFGRLQSASKIAKSESKQALYFYEQTILKALAEIETALKDFEQEQRRSVSLSQAVDDAKQAVNIAHKRYTQGLTSLLELLDVQRNLFALQEQLASSNATEAINLVRLNKAVGSGWQIVVQTQKSDKDLS